MDRRQRHVVVIAVAVLTATLASFGVYLTLKRMPVRQVEVASTFVVVATRAFPTGVRLAAADLKVVPWPSGSMVAGGFTAVDEVVGRSLLASVVENEPMVASKLAARDAGAGLSSAIPPGMRAMSVKVNDVIGVAGFLDPGTRVDLMVTIRRRDDTTSRTVASNVEVLRAGTRGDHERPTDAKAPSPAAAAAVVTLLVTPEDAERITLAQAEGQIMLSLRNPLDTNTTESAGVRTAALFGQPPEPAPVVKAVSVRKAPPPAPAAVVVPPPAPKTYTVEAIRAAKRSEEVVH